MLNYRKGNVKFWLKGKPGRNHHVIFNSSAFMWFCSPMIFYSRYTFKKKYKVGTITSHHKKQLLHLLEQCTRYYSEYGLYYALYYS